MAKMNKKLISLLHTLPSMGMAFIVLGVLLMVASFAFSIKSNIMRAFLHPGWRSVFLFAEEEIATECCLFEGIHNERKDKPVIDLSFSISLETSFPYYLYSILILVQERSVCIPYHGY